MDGQRDPARSAVELHSEMDHFTLKRLPRTDGHRVRTVFIRRQSVAVLMLRAFAARRRFCLTQVLDRPLSGRCFFEEVIRENLDIGRPSQVQLIFDRKVTRRTPGRFRTRVLTDGVVPSLHVGMTKIGAVAAQFHVRFYAEPPL